MDSSRYSVEWNRNFYAILDQGNLIINGNLWQHAPEDFDPLVHNAEFVAAYEATGLTIWDIHNFVNGHDVPGGEENVRRWDDIVCGYVR